MPSLLKSSDLVSAHIQRGRLDAEGFEVAVVHENASQLWGGAVCGGPVLIAPGKAFPEIVETVASVEPVDPPEEAQDGGIPVPATAPGLFGAMLLGVVLSGILFAGLVATENLWSFFDILRDNPEWLSYGLPIPLIAPDWREAGQALVGGALGGPLVYGLVLSLKYLPVRCLAAAFILIFVYFLYGLAILLAFAIFAALVWLVSLGGPRRKMPPRQGRQ